MTNSNNHEEQAQFKSEFEEEFAEGFVEILDDLKRQSITPVVRIFVNQIETFGYTLEEVLWSLSDLINQRSWNQATHLLEEAAREIGRRLAVEKETPSQATNTEGSSET